MRPILAKIQQDQLRNDLPEFRSGDTVRVNVRLKEGDKERIQSFEGVVIARRGIKASASFTVRRVSFGIGVERIFPANSPSISSIDVLHRGKVRRSKLYYLRELKGRAARIKRSKRLERIAEVIIAEPIVPDTPPETETLAASEAAGSQGNTKS